MLKSEVYPTHCSIQKHWGGVGQFNIGWYRQLSEILTNLYQTFTDIKALKVMNVDEILIIYLIPEKNNGQKVCFMGNLKRLVTITHKNGVYIYLWR